MIISENDRSAQDSLFKIAPNLFKFSDSDKSSDIYQNLVNSGEVKILENSEITSRLQELEEVYIHMNRMENIHWEIILEILGKDILDVVNLSTGESSNPEYLYSYPFQNRFVLLISIMEEKDEVYQTALKQIEHLSNLIEEEIEK